jgi:hypothetical protein
MVSALNSANTLRTVMMMVGVMECTHSAPAVRKAPAAMSSQIGCRRVRRYSPRHLRSAALGRIRWSRSRTTIGRHGSFRHRASSRFTFARCAVTASRPYRRARES